MLSLPRLGPQLSHIRELSNNCVQEYAHRFAIWLDNLEFIHSSNKEGKSFWVSLNMPHLVLHIGPVVLPEFVTFAAARPQSLC